MEIELKPKQLERLSSIQVKRDAIRKEITKFDMEESLILEVLFEENGVTDVTKLASLNLENGKLIYEFKPEPEPAKKGKNKKAIMEALKK
jgi:hypothetical protein